MRKPRWIIVLAGLVFLCVLSIAIVAISNQRLPTHSAAVEHLSEEQKMLLAEAAHQRRSLGDTVWPGWGDADIAFVVYNEAYAFLVGYQGTPADGWQRVPGDETIGAAWEQVPGDAFFGEPYYRQALVAGGAHPQAFTVRVGDQWAASMPTKEWLEIDFVQQFRESLPSFVRPVLPYALIRNLFLGGSEKYISLLSHESFHAFQGLNAEERLLQAELANRRYQEHYPWEDRSLETAWDAELTLLADAAEEAQNGASDERLAEMARQFLILRERRREANDLNSMQVQFEQQREWVEGQAKYMELQSWLLASEDDYTPLPDAAERNDLASYKGADDAWSKEIDQIRRMAGDHGDGRFYYSGLAQAVLLDHLRPGWKAEVLNGEATLEALLSEGLGPQ
ncbi:MAG TPA: hypothetical protein VK879_02025 [Candidatus Sulfomarinibacteraceae bacterium]|nr:hypothetical protein [Candidatus Sulfomarinibacteraceae bacterium]